MNQSLCLGDSLASLGQGYSIKEAALAYLSRHEDALNAYKEGLKYVPENQQLRDNVREVQSQMSQGRFDSGFLNLFAGAGILDKLKNDPRTKEFFNDPSYLKLILDLQQNPQSLITKLKDPRVMTTLSVLLGFDLSGAAGGKDDVEMDSTLSTKPESSKPKEEPIEVELSPEKKQVKNVLEAICDPRYRKTALKISILCVAFSFLENWRTVIPENVQPMFDCILVGGHAYGVYLMVTRIIDIMKSKPKPIHD